MELRMTLIGEKDDRQNADEKSGEEEKKPQT